MKINGNSKLLTHLFAAGGGLVAGLLLQEQRVRKSFAADVACASAKVVQEPCACHCHCDSNSNNDEKLQQCVSQLGELQHCQSQLEDVSLLTSQLRTCEAKVLQLQSAAAVAPTAVVAAAASPAADPHLAPVWQSLATAAAWVEAKRTDPDMMQLWTTYDGKNVFHRWKHYADHYQMHLPGPSLMRSQRKKIKMMEIGVQSGGSVEVWRQFYGELLYFVGVDIDPRCKRSEVAKHDTYIEIGSQMDHSFMESVCARHGPFDVIIDDGGHTSQMIQGSLEVMLANPRCINQESGIYVVEDTLVLRRCKDGFCRTPSDISSIFGRVFENMHWPYGNDKHGPVAVTMYRSIVFIQLGKQEEEEIIKRGNSEFKADDVHLNGKNDFKPWKWTTEAQP